MIRVIWGLMSTNCSVGFQFQISCSCCLAPTMQCNVCCCCFIVHACYAVTIDRTIDITIDNNIKLISMMSSNCCVVILIQFKTSCSCTHHATPCNAVSVESDIVYCAHVSMCPGVQQQNWDGHTKRDALHRSIDISYLKTRRKKLLVKATDGLKLFMLMWNQIRYLNTSWKPEERGCWWKPQMV